MKYPSKIGLIIEQIQKNINKLILSEMKKTGLDELSPTQGRLLFALMKKDLIPIQDLATRLSLSNSTLTFIIDALEQKNFIKRVKSGEDRRITLIELNKEKTNIMNKYSQILDEITKKIYRDIAKADILVFESIAKQILENLKETNQA